MYSEAFQSDDSE
jgi:hypothetical protein